MTTNRSRNPRGHGDLLREEILRAAIDLIDETDDAAALTLRGIARRAGISAPAIYAHFADLPKLIDAMLAKSFTQLATAVQNAIEREAEPDRQLIVAGDAYVRFGQTHPARYGVMFAAEGYAQNAVQTFVLVSQSLQRCIDVGLSASTNPRDDVWMVWAALHGIATLRKPARADYLRLGTLDRAALLETTIRRIARLTPG
ncbi:TetR/AcrR family transcriptional regulator [Microbacterium sp.]|uniref:TetR/AcrR family transcriptional regulator n=1 Tax=Microbacterium sp. TaxID=51671 RepID=UPI003A95A45E